MFGKATINFGTKSRVVVPDVAVVKQAGSGDYYVYTYADGKVKNNKVQLGKRMGDRYELISGIENNSQVVIAGHAGINDGAEVEVIE
jgi:multidrug efflux pump subunit AcrA (membrane-fusion protein)